MTSDLWRTSALGGWLRLFSMLIVTVLACVVLSSGHSTDAALALLPWFCSAFLCYLAPIFVLKKTDLFSPPGLVGLQGGLATAAMLAMISKDGGVLFEPLGFLPESERIDLARRAAILIMIGHLSYLFGYYRASGRLVSRLFPNVGGRRWHGGRLMLAIIVTTLATVPAYYLFQRQMGGAIFDVTALGRGRRIIQEDPANSWMVRSIGLAFVPPVLLACAAIAERSRALLAISVATFGVAGILVTRLGSRAPAVMVGLVLLGLFHLCWRKVPVSALLGLLLVAVVGVNMLGDYRSTGAAQADVAQGMSRPAESIASHEQDRHRLDVLGIVLHHFPERHDYLLGESYQALPLFWVPRWLWPEKREYFGWGDTAIVHRLTGLRAPTPFYAVAYANFSWFGLVVGMALFGAFHRGLAVYRERSPSDVGVTSIYMVVGALFSPTFLGLSATIQYAVPLTILIYAVSQPPQGTSPAPRSVPLSS